MDDLQEQIKSLEDEIERLDARSETLKKELWELKKKEMTTNT